MKLTKRQKEIYDYLCRRDEQGESPPTYREIAAYFGFNSPRAATDHIQVLEKKKYLRTHSGRSRSIQILRPARRKRESTLPVPILGEAPAGIPIDQEQHKDGWIEVDLQFVGKASRESCFAVRVRGDSMKGIGICDGDIALADNEVSPRPGDVVVALLDSETTVKTLARGSGGFYLKAENPDYPDLYPNVEMRIQGVVVTVIRRLERRR